MKRYQTLAAPRLAAACAVAMALQLVATRPARGQDAVVADPKHYTVEFEDDQVRVLRVVYGPHEKSVMHEHPASVGVYLTDGHIRITLPDGKSGEPHVKAGRAMWHPAGKHLIENLGSTQFELVLTELEASAAPVK
jgi:quercetin dioxygenase-like cupin family protein